MEKKLIYTNAASVTWGPFDVVFDFLTKKPVRDEEGNVTGSDTADEVTVVMSYEHFAAFQDMLNKSLENIKNNKETVENN